MLSAEDGQQQNGESYAGYWSRIAFLTAARYFPSYTLLENFKSLHFSFSRGNYAHAGVHKKFSGLAIAVIVDETDGFLLAGGQGNRHERIPEAVSLGKLMNNSCPISAGKFYKQSLKVKGTILRIISYVENHMSQFLLGDFLLFCQCALYRSKHYKRVGF